MDVIIIHILLYVGGDVWYFLPCLICERRIPTLPIPLTGPEAIVETAVVTGTTAWCG